MLVSLTAATPRQDRPRPASKTWFDNPAGPFKLSHSHRGLAGPIRGWGGRLGRGLLAISLTVAGAAFFAQSAAAHDPDQIHACVETIQPDSPQMGMTLRLIYVPAAARFPPNISPMGNENTKCQYPL